ncbi:MAG: tRNA lysidine(34) synthetase TilS [Jannaschia sp.]
MAAPDLTLDPDDAPFGVAVSGGADSLALLLLAHDRGWVLRAVTVDHGLRPEARAEAIWVGEICAPRGIAHDILPLNLSDGPALQARARSARYTALADWAREHGIGAVLLGHTRDDVAETFLMRLADGAGLDGLARMATRFTRDGAVFRRPLLDIDKATLRTVVAGHGLVPVEDPSNRDPRFERTQLRRLLAQARIDSAEIAASAKALRAVRDSVEARTALIVRDIATMDRGDWMLDREGWTALLHDEPEQARRVVLTGLRWVGSGAHPPRRTEQVELLRRMTSGEAATLAGCLIVAEPDHIRIAREPAAAMRAPDAAPGSTWDGRWHVEGPPKATIRALGEAVADTDWRATGLPRRSLMASPGLWDGDTLLSAPLVEPGGPWTATCSDPFATPGEMR